MINNEDIERKMEFIVEQQAQFASDMQRLEESQARTEQVAAQTSERVAQTAETVAHLSENVAHLSDNVAQTMDVVTRLTNVTHAGFTDVNAKINALVDAQIRTEESVARTNENLTNFIAQVDRRFREDRNRN